MLQSGLDEKWWADPMERYTYLRNIQDLLSDRKIIYERRFGEPFEGPIIPFGSLVEYYLSSAKDQSRIHQFGKKVLPGLFLGYALYAGWIWKGDVLVADIEELETMDASEIYSTRLNAKELVFPKENGKFIFPVADGRIKFIGGDQELRTSTLMRDHPIRGESQWDFLGESEGSLPPPQNSLPDAGEAINDFWSMSGNFIYSHHVEFRVKLHSPREESFPIPLKYIDVSRTTHTNLDVKQEKRIDDYWNIDGSQDLSDLCTGFTRFILLEEKPPDGFLWSGWRLTRKQLTSRPDHLWPELWEKMGKNAKLREKQKWSHEKLTSITHENYEGSISSTLRTRNSNIPSRMLVRNWKHQWLLLCPAKLSRAIRIVGMVHPTKLKNKTCVYSGSSWIYKNAHGRIIAESSWRPYCRKRRQYTTALKFGSQIYSYASSCENSNSKGSSGQGMGGIFKDVRFYPIMNFGHFWAPPRLWPSTKSITMVNRFFWEAEGDHRKEGQEGTEHGLCPFRVFRGVLGCFGVFWVDDILEGQRVTKEGAQNQPKFNME